MITVDTVHISPVKSLGLQHPRSVYVAAGGIVEDRRLHLISDAGQLLTQREVGALVQVGAEYQAEPERIRLEFPGGEVLEGPLALGRPVVTKMWGRQVPGRVVDGTWGKALSEFSGGPVHLVRSEEPGQSYDEYPISLLSHASLEELKRHSLEQASLDSRRFRPNLLLDGCEPHEEDTWIGGKLQIGEELVLGVVARDPRCAITTHDPDTGERDLDTVRLILGYRPSPRAAYFGVYGVVEQPGSVSVGDRATCLGA